MTEATNRTPYLALIKPEDKKRLDEIADTIRISPAIVAGQLIHAGCLLLRDERIATKVGGNCGRYLWICINRDHSEYSVKVPVNDIRDHFEEFGLYYEDARNMNRDLGDWLGTLLHVGLLVFDAPHALSVLTNYCPIQILCKSAAFDVAKEKGGL